MSSRRDFIQKIALIGGALSFPQALDARPLTLIRDDFSSGLSDDAYWKSVREQFPLNAKKIYLNNGTLGPSPWDVLETVQQSMLRVDRDAVHGFGEKEALQSIASLIGAETEEISLTHNATEGNNIVCAGLPLKRGDEVIITGHEHIGNAGPWVNRYKRDGIVLKVIPLAETAEAVLETIRKHINPKTRVISIPHIPCTNGQLLPVQEICSLARANGIWSCIDGAHPPGMLQVNVKDLGCDFFASCCHKWMLGPKGTGFLYVDKAHRDVLAVHMAGAGVDEGWDILQEDTYTYGYKDTGHRFYYGTQNESLYKGITAAVSFLQDIGMERIEKRVKELASYLQDQLIHMGNGIEMLTPTESLSRAAIISFRLKEVDMKELYHFLHAQQHIVTRYVAESGLNCMRVSTHIYNSYAEIDRFLDAVDRFVHS